MRPLEGKHLTSSLLIVIVDELKYHNDELIPEMVDMFEKVLFLNVIPRSSLRLG